MRVSVYLSSEHGRSLRSTQKSAEVDGQRLQGLIDGNKRWLEMRKKDNNVYPFITHIHPHNQRIYIHINKEHTLDKNACTAMTVCVCVE